MSFPDPKSAPLPDEPPAQLLRRALELLRQARALVRKAKALKAYERVRMAISSTEGAVRHAELQADAAPRAAPCPHCGDDLRHCSPDGFCTNRDAQAYPS